MPHTKTSTKSEILRVNGVSKSFLVGPQRVPVLKNISFTVESGNFLIIYGPSGCGKSTLLHTILGLEPPAPAIFRFVDLEPRRSHVHSLSVSHLTNVL